MATVGKAEGHGIRRYFVLMSDSTSTKSIPTKNNKGFYMDRTDFYANLRPCVRLFIELLSNEFGEVNSSENAVSVSLQKTKALEEDACMEKDI